MTTAASRALVLALCLTLPHLASAQGGSNGGRSTFMQYCATCHGPSAKGDGPMAPVLTKRPADLTRIAKRNGGSYPASMVTQIIDGRKPVKGHGGGEMPVWGDAFGKSADPTPVAERIEGLVQYLETIQSAQ